MNAYRVEILVIDFDQCGPEEIKSVITNARYPNRCISPQVMGIDERDIGEWDDDHPMNKRDTAAQHYRKIFGISELNKQTGGGRERKEI